MSYNLVPFPDAVKDYTVNFPLHMQFCLFLVKHEAIYTVGEGRTRRTCPTVSVPLCFSLLS